MNQRRSVLVQDEAITAGDVKTYDLPINPLSHIVFVLKCLNVADEATLAEVLARITKISVSRMGQSLIDISGADLFALNCVWFGKEPTLSNRVATDTATRHLGLIIPSGRRLYDPKECWPKTAFGEFKLEITLSSTETACDGVIYQIETVELLDAAPVGFTKITTLSKTPAATGELDVDLPIGNDLLGVLAWGTTVPTTTAWTATIEWLKILRDNVESQIAKANWEGLKADLLNRVGYIGDHSAAFGADQLSLYALVDLDPLKDGSLALKTAGASSIKARVYAGDTNAFRLLPIEYVKA